MPKVKSGFYAVKAGRQTGILETWEECESSVSGFVGNKYKKFPTRAQAEEWLKPVGPTLPTTSVSTPAPSRVRSLPVKSPSYSQATVNKTNLGDTSLNVFSSVAELTSADEQIVYSDGACKNNGKIGAVAGVGVWWGHDDPRNIAERCPGRQTNNRAELIALVRVLESCKDTTYPLRVKTDSRYSISVNDWLPNWTKNGFMNAKKQPVENADLIRYLAKHLERRVLLKRNVSLVYVKGHSGILGNEMADKMANDGCLLPAQEKDREWAKLTRELEKELEVERQRLNTFTRSPVVVRGSSKLSNEELEALAELSDFDDAELSF